MEDKLEKLKKESNLSDIILEKDNSSVDKTKKYLLGAASAILLFLIGLIVIKMLNTTNTSPSENLANIGENVEQKSQELKTEASDIIDEDKNTLFKEEPIIDESSETDLKFEEMVRKLKQQDAQEDQEVSSVETNNTNTAPAKEESVIDKITEATKAPIKTIQEEVTSGLKPSSSTPVAVSTPISTPKEVIISTHEEFTPTSSPAPLPIASMSGYFIQVGATAKSFPDRRFLTKIKNSGYDYIIHKVVIKGQNIKKVLIGPYNTRGQARDDLSSVQSKINPSAYIYRVK